MHKFLIATVIALSSLICDKGNSQEPPRKVACPAFNMGQWGGSPNIWYAPYCDPDSGAVALTLPNNAAACSCENKDDCASGLLGLMKGTPIATEFEYGYPGPYLDWNKPFSPMHISPTRLTVDKWAVRFIDKENNTTLHAAVIRMNVIQHTALVPLSAVVKPDSVTDTVAAIKVPLNVEEFESIIAFEVDASTFPQKSVLANSSYKKDGTNVFNIVFENGDQPILASVLMKDRRSNP